MTVFLTVLSGVLIFVLGQLILKLVIEPVQEFKRTVADIALALIEYANVYANPGVADQEVAKKVSEELRKLASRLHSQIYLIPSYQVTAKVFRLPSRKKITNCSEDLIGLSNGVFEASANLPIVNCQRADAIRHSLGIFVPEVEITRVRK
jgi:hypothetical protein